VSQSQSLRTVLGKPEAQANSRQQGQARACTCGKVTVVRHQIQKVAEYVFVYMQSTVSPGQACVASSCLGRLAGVACSFQGHAEVERLQATADIVAMLLSSTRVRREPYAPEPCTGRHLADALLLSCNCRLLLRHSCNRACSCTSPATLSNTNTTLHWMQLRTRHETRWQ
jgi:hypothetical protein